MPVNKRHLDMVYCPHPVLGQAVHGLGHGPVAGRGHGRVGEDHLRRGVLEDNTVVLSLINANSPLVWDSTMLGAARVYAEGNQATLITPFILAGAMSPVTAAARRPDAGGVPWPG